MRKNNIKLLFVCSGNICRSPTAEGIMSHLVQKRGLSDVIQVDSAGTNVWQSGGQPDKRAQRMSLAKGISIANLKSRQVEKLDLFEFDYLFAMDKSHYKFLQELANRTVDLSSDLESANINALHQKIQLFLQYSSDKYTYNVPDPYINNEFELVFDMIFSTCENLLQHLVKRFELQVG